MMQTMSAITVHLVWVRASVCCWIVFVSLCPSFSLKYNSFVCVAFDLWIELKAILSYQGRHLHNFYRSALNMSWITCQTAKNASVYKYYPIWYRNTNIAIEIWTPGEKTTMSIYRLRYGIEKRQNAMRLVWTKQTLTMRL